MVAHRAETRTQRTHASLRPSRRAAGGTRLAELPTLPGGEVKGGGFPASAGQQVAYTSARQVRLATDWPAVLPA